MSSLGNIEGLIVHEIVEIVIESNEADLKKIIETEMENKDELADLALNEIQDKCVKIENKLQKWLVKTKYLILKRWSI